jgi:hypothetical protein
MARSHGKQPLGALPNFPSGHPMRKPVRLNSACACCGEPNTAVRPDAVCFECYFSCDDNCCERGVTDDMRDAYIMSYLEFEAYRKSLEHGTD